MATFWTRRVLTIQSLYPNRRQTFFARGRKTGCHDMMHSVSLSSLLLITSLTGIRNLKTGPLPSDSPHLPIPGIGIGIP